uniref:Uncharacterized protein n=1 Tax=Ciona intestinalis TaxID=7719 RepID=H2XNN2_CIOIN
MHYDVTITMHTTFTQQNFDLVLNLFETFNFWIVT